MIDYTSIRHTLHSHPDTAGNEEFAHNLIVAHLQQLHPSKVYTHVGGWGVVAAWGDTPDAPTIALRADTDALPIGHRCGHDGHTTALLRACELIDAHRSSLPSGRNIVAIFQPAEETGQGAQAIVESGILQAYNIVGIYGCHNLPGHPLGQVILCNGTFAAASAGMIYRVVGRPSHASTPELGLNPGLATADIIQRFQSLCTPPDIQPISHFRQSTLIGIRLGNAAFGTSAGEAELMFTLRAFSNSGMKHLLAEAEQIVAEATRAHHLGLTTAMVEPFMATENHPSHIAPIAAAASAAGLKVAYRDTPFRWSEDFATYLAHYPGAFFGIGSGESQPELHHPDYNYPDALIDPTAQLLLHLALQHIN